MFPLLATVVALRTAVVWFAWKAPRRKEGFVSKKPGSFFFYTYPCPYPTPLVQSCDQGEMVPALRVYCVRGYRVEGNAALGIIPSQCAKSFILLRGFLFLNTKKPPGERLGGEPPQLLNPEGAKVPWLRGRPPYHPQHPAQ